MSYGVFDGQPDGTFRALLGRGTGIVRLFFAGAAAGGDVALGAIPSEL